MVDTHSTLIIFTRTLTTLFFFIKELFAYAESQVFLKEARLSDFNKDSAGISDFSLVADTL